MDETLFSLGGVNIKNIVILGASRAGKSTLAKMINKIYPEYHIISGDSIRHAFQNELPQNKINKFGGDGMMEDYSRFCASYFKNQIARNIDCFNYIFDSCDVSVINALKYFSGENIFIIFLGYGKLSKYEVLDNYRKYEKVNDWTSSRSDAELLEHAENWINNSKIFEEECKKYNVMYVDTSVDREKVLNNILKLIIKECK